MSLVRVNLSYMGTFGGILILTVLGLRMLLKNKLPKGTFSILWCVALLRLLVPFAVDSPVGVFAMIQGQAAAWQNRIAALQDNGTAGGKDRRSISLVEIFSEGLYFGGASGYEEAIGGNSGSGNAAGMEEISVEGSTPNGGSQAESGFPQESWEMSLFRRIDITGAIVCAAAFLALYLNCLRRFRTALPVENPSVEQWLDRNRLFRKVRVRQSDRIASPLTYGILRPVILLPGNLEQGEGQKLEYILQHELVHIRRFDGVWKLAMGAALCLHWFHPLVWVMYVFMNRDLELSCDEEVLHLFGTEARKDYALTLIGMEERRHLPVSLYSGFGKNAVEERIGEIMKYKKKTKAAVGAAAVLVLAVACIFATTSRAKEDTSDADQVLPEENVSASLPMDPPVGLFGENDSADGDDVSGAAAGRDSGGDARTADGWDEELRAMAQTFSTVPPEPAEVRDGPDEGISEVAREMGEAEMARQLIQNLIKAADGNDHDSILQYMAEGYEDEMDCLDSVREWRQGEVQVRLHPSGDYCCASIRIRTDESEEDSVDYLTVELVKEGDDWKICFMGVEK